MVDVAQAFAQGWQLQQAGNLQEAEQWYRHALAVQPGHLDALRQLGSICLSTGRFGEAAVAFRQVLYSCPYLGDLHNDLGIALAQQGFLQEAVSAFRQAIEVQPDYATAHNNLALALLRLKRPVEAEASARRAVELDAGFVDAHVRIGEALRLQGKLDRAIETFEYALKVGPDSADAHNNLGIAIAQTGREELAESHFRRRSSCARFRARVQQPRNGSPKLRPLCRSAALLRAGPTMGAGRSDPAAQSSVDLAAVGRPRARLAGVRMAIALSRHSILRSRSATLARASD